MCSFYFILLYYLVDKFFTEYKTGIVSTSTKMGVCFIYPFPNHLDQLKKKGERELIQRHASKSKVRCIVQPYSSQLKGPD